MNPITEASIISSFKTSLTDKCNSLNITLYEFFNGTNEPTTTLDKFNQGLTKLGIDPDPNSTTMKTWINRYQNAVDQNIIELQKLDIETRENNPINNSYLGVSKCLQKTVVSEQAKQDQIVNEEIKANPKIVNNIHKINKDILSEAKQTPKYILQNVYLQLQKKLSIGQMFSIFKNSFYIKDPQNTGYVDKTDWFDILNNTILLNKSENQLLQTDVYRHMNENRLYWYVDLFHKINEISKHEWDETVFEYNIEYNDYVNSLRRNINIHNINYKEKWFNTFNNEYAVSKPQFRRWFRDSAFGCYLNVEVDYIFDVLAKDSLVLEWNVFDKAVKMETKVRKIKRNEPKEWGNTMGDYQNFKVDSILDSFNTWQGANSMGNTGGVEGKTGNDNDGKQPQNTVLKSIAEENEARNGTYNNTFNNINENNANEGISSEIPGGENLIHVYFDKDSLSKSYNIPNSPIVTNPEIVPTPNIPQTSLVSIIPILTSKYPFTEFISKYEIKIPDTSVPFYKYNSKFITKDLLSTNSESRKPSFLKHFKEIDAYISELLSHHHQYISLTLYKQLGWFFQDKYKEIYDKFQAIDTTNSGFLPSTAINSVFNSYKIIILGEQWTVLLNSLNNKKLSTFSYEELLGNIFCVPDRQRHMLHNIEKEANYYFNEYWVDLRHYIKDNKLDYMNCYTLLFKSSPKINKKDFKHFCQCLDYIWTHDIEYDYIFGKISDTDDSKEYLDKNELFTYINSADITVKRFIYKSEKNNIVNLINESWDSAGVIDRFNKNMNRLLAGNDTIMNERNIYKEFSEFYALMNKQLIKFDIRNIWDFYMIKYEKKINTWGYIQVVQWNSFLECIKLNTKSVKIYDNLVETFCDASNGLFNFIAFAKGFYAFYPNEFNFTDKAKEWKYIIGADRITANKVVYRNNIRVFSQGDVNVIYQWCQYINKELKNFKHLDYRSFFSGFDIFNKGYLTLRQFSCVWDDEIGLGKEYENAWEVFFDFVCDNVVNCQGERMVEIGFLFEVIMKYSELEG